MIFVIVCLTLIWVVIEDLTRYRIRNIAVIVLIICFVIDCITRGRVRLLAPHAIFAVVCLAFMLIAFALRAVGGGDAKLMSAAVFWTGPEGVLLFGLVLFCLTIVYLGLAWCGWAPMRKSGKGVEIPFGASIACALMTTIGISAM